MNVLVTGAAGYIGSVVTGEVVREGNFVVAFDSLARGHRQAISPEIEFVHSDLADQEKLDELFRSCRIDSYRIDVVIHLAAESAVTHSSIDLGRFFYSNITYGLNLLEAMIRNGVFRFIFSSTAAVYGNTIKQPINEDDLKRPINPYGESKLIFERILHWYGHAYGLKFISLRYFNAAGATENIGEDHDPETHLIPNILKVALGQKNEVHVFGTDYPTKDGSCIRDYVHVLDIAKAHIIPLKFPEKNEVNKAYNLGNSGGYSVLEVIEVARKITGTEIPVKVYPRRQGDPSVLVANSSLARSELGWQPEFSNLETIIDSAWQWQMKHPRGYG